MSEEAYGSFKRWETERNRAQELEKRAADLAHEIILLQYKVIDKDKKIAELEAENGVIRQLMNTYNLAGWTDSLQALVDKDKRIAELEDALLRQTAIVRYYAGDFVCECGWVVDVGICGDSKFNFCPGCSSKLDWTEVAK